jgi:hypothetical protein
MNRPWWALSLLILACGAKKKPPAVVAPPLGWHQEEGWSGSCYFPPDFANMGNTDRRMIRQQALTEVMSQWRGERNDGVSVDHATVESVETVLLGLPEKIEQVAIKNLELCRAAMSGGDKAAWTSWVTNLPRKLMEGECRHPHDDTLYNYMDLGIGWQFAIDVCDEDIIEIVASEMDEYRVDDGGPWINASGDAAKSTSGLADYPCNLEGCLAGQLVLRFRGESGVTIIKPVGLRLVFEPPEHGAIDVTFNDPTPFNNEFRVVRGIQHRTGVTYTSLD